MGQRHQIYLAFRPGDAEKQNSTIVIGAHHQWLYGRMAVKQASRMLQFVTGISYCGEYEHTNPFYDKARALRTLEALYTMIPENGYYTSVCMFEGSQDNGEKSDPRLGDNNDGITVFDFRDLKNPAYCFMRLPNIGDTCVSNLRGGKTVSAEQYLKAYYSLKASDPLRNYEQCLVREAKTPAALKRAQKRIKEMRVENSEVLKPFNKIKVMPETSMKEIFPSMYALAEISASMAPVG